jgi:hypothetical protein
LLPERDPGVLPPPVRPGAPPRPGPLEARAKSWSATLARDGFEDLGPKALQADAEGAGRVLLDLTPGCHRIGVFSVDSRDDTSVHDIDAELTVLSGDVVASEHTESPDATLFACAGERDVGVLSFAGAAPHGSLLLLHGVSRIPEGLPALWGRDARAAVAYNLTERHLPVPTAEPIVSAMGTAGITMVPIELVPGQCYLAAVSVIEGTAKLVSVGVTVGPSVSSSHTEEPGDAAAATFCAADRDRATISVEVHGQALAWVLGVWPGSAQRLGEEAP